MAVSVIDRDSPAAAFFVRMALAGRQLEPHRGKRRTHLVGQSAQASALAGLDAAWLASTSNGLD